MGPLAALVGVYRRLPAPARARLRALFSARGHAPGFAQRLRARQLARTHKRLDIIAEQFFPMLATAGVGDLRNMSVLEFGSGHLLSEPMLCWLAGAAGVDAVDLFPLLQIDEIGAAIAGADAQRLRAAVAAHGGAAAFERRWPLLRRVGRWREQDLAGFDIRYFGGADIMQGDGRLSRYDLITSNSVMEHVPAAVAGATLESLFRLLKPGGAMVHNIHLEDHLDPANAPFAFLAAGAAYATEQADERGNRLRASDWLALHRALPGADASIASFSSRPATLLPPELAPQFAAYGRDDLRTAQIVIVARRSAGA